MYTSGLEFFQGIPIGAPCFKTTLFVFKKALGYFLSCNKCSAYELSFFLRSWKRLAYKIMGQFLLRILMSDFFIILGELTCRRAIDLSWINIDTLKPTTSVTKKNDQKTQNLRHLLFPWVIFRKLTKSCSYNLKQKSSKTTFLFLQKKLLRPLVLSSLKH